MEEGDKPGAPAVGYNRRRRRSAAILLCAILALAGAALAAVSYRNSIKPSGIVLHHSAVPLSPDGSPPDARVLDEIHRQRGYAIFYWGRVYHVGYHYIILPDGTVESGRPERCRGAHAVGHNSDIGICLVGDFSAAGNPSGAHGPAEPTAAQMRALAELTARLRKRYDIPVERVRPHRDVNPNTECPGDRFPFRELLPQIER